MRTVVHAARCQLDSDDLFRRFVDPKMQLPPRSPAASTHTVLSDVPLAGAEYLQAVLST